MCTQKIRIFFKEAESTVIILKHHYYDIIHMSSTKRSASEDGVDGVQIDRDESASSKKATLDTHKVVVPASVKSKHLDENVKFIIANGNYLFFP